MRGNKPPVLLGVKKSLRFLEKTVDNGASICYTTKADRTAYRFKAAGVAQPVEQLICNQQVGGSNPSTSSNLIWEDSRVAKGGRL